MIFKVIVDIFYHDSDGRKTILIRKLEDKMPVRIYSTFKNIDQIRRLNIFDFKVLGTYDVLDEFSTYLIYILRNGDEDFWNIFVVNNIDRDYWSERIRSEYARPKDDIVIYVKLFGEEDNRLYRYMHIMGHV